MATLSELTVQVLTARLTRKEMSLEELQKEMITISNMIKSLDEGTLSNVIEAREEPKTNKKINFKQYFKKDEVICLICDKGFKTLKRHLDMAHQLKPSEYRKQFGIPSTQSLAAKSYSDSRRQMALDKGLGEGLVKYRADQAAKKVTAAPVMKAKAPAPAVKAKAPVAKGKVVVVKEKPAKAKATVPVVKKNAASPVKVDKKK